VNTDVVARDFLKHGRKTARKNRCGFDSRHLKECGITQKIATRLAYGEALKKLGEENDKIVVLDADLACATFTDKFRDAFPERFFQLGIAEANMINVAAGLSDMGYIPFASTFAVFGLGRAYDQVRNTVAYGNYNVKLAMTHAGLTCGPDGGSHQSIEDIALARVIPNLTVLCPCDANQTFASLRTASEHVGPVYIRLSRMATPVYDPMPVVLGGSHVMREGGDAVFFACGVMVSQCLEASEILAREGIGAAVVDLYSIKPIDAETVLRYAEKCRRVFVAEDHSIYGGLGDAVSCVLEDKGCFPVRRFGARDRFGTSAEAEVLLSAYGLDGQSMASQVRSLL
jgi:transketolase